MISEKLPFPRIIENGWYWLDYSNDSKNWMEILEQHQGKIVKLRGWR